MTVKEVLAITVDNLNGISVPRWLNEQIGIPIDNAIENIKLCIEVLNRPVEQKKEQKKEENKDGNDQAE